MNCPICNSVKVVKNKRRGIFVCFNCDVGFSEYFNVEESDYNVRYSLNIVGVASSRKEKKLIHRLKLFSNGNKLLDVGCGFGNFVEEACKAGFNAMGIESVESSVLKGKEARRNIIQSTIEDFQTTAKYDIVTLLHVLEHTNEPKFVLDKIKNLLNSNGIIVICVPNRNSLASMIMGSHWEWFQGKDHKYHFSVSSLKYIFNIMQYDALQIMTRKNYASNIFAGTFFRLPFVFTRWIGLFGKIRNQAFENSKSQGKASKIFSLYNLYSKFINVITYPLSVLYFPVRVLLEKYNYGEEIFTIIKMKNNH